LFFPGIYINTVIRLVYIIEDDREKKMVDGLDINNKKD